MKREDGFTEEQIRILAKNKYTRKVGKNYLSVTREFKRKFCQLQAEGIPNREIFKQCGYDPKIIETYRMANIARMTKGKTPEDFPDKPLPKSKMREFDEKSDKRAMKQMQLEMKRMHQEIEFLKKIMATGVIESEDD